MIRSISGLLSLYLRLVLLRVIRSEHTPPGPAPTPENRISYSGFCKRSCPAVEDPVLHDGAIVCVPGVTCTFAMLPGGTDAVDLIEDRPDFPLEHGEIVLYGQEYRFVVHTEVVMDYLIPHPWPASLQGAPG